MSDLKKQSISNSQIEMLEGIASTRAIRRYKDEEIPKHHLRDILWSATRAPSGSNRQPFRLVVLTKSTKASKAKRLIGNAAKTIWDKKSVNDQYDSGSGKNPNSPKSRMARTMRSYVENFDSVPCLILPCLVRYRDPSPMEGASIYPAVQNLMLAARALGYGGVITGFHGPVDQELKSLLAIPSDVFIACTVTLGKPEGSHGPVRRRPLSELVYEDEWLQSPDWSIDPPNTRFTSAGPPTKTR